MTQAVAVRRDGDAFQARIFWRKAIACWTRQVLWRRWALSLAQRVSTMYGLLTRLIMPRRS